LAALPEEDAQRVIERNEPALNHYGEITAAQMTELVKETRERGWASLGNTAVPGALGVGMAWYGADGLPKVGVSVASLVVRMPWHRQLWIAELLREQLAANTWPRRHRSIRKAF
jgi:DNA-binding IclR family transcriptional regulator